MPFVKKSAFVRLEAARFSAFIDRLAKLVDAEALPRSVGVENRRPGNLKVSFVEGNAPPCLLGPIEPHRTVQSE
jgi:hypothetical protein